MTIILGKTRHQISPPGETTWVDRRPVSSGAPSFFVWGSLQPAMGDALQLLPEASRREARKILLCDARQRVIPDGSRVVASDGNTYLVLINGDWTNHRVLPGRIYVLGEVVYA